MSEETPREEFSREYLRKITGKKEKEQVTDYFRTELFNVLTELVLLKNGTLNPGTPEEERDRIIKELELKESDCLIRLAQCKGLMFQSN